MFDDQTEQPKRSERPFTNLIVGTTIGSVVTSWRTRVRLHCDKEQTVHQGTVSHDRSSLTWLFRRNIGSGNPASRRCTSTCRSRRRRSRTPRPCTCPAWRARRTPARTGLKSTAQRRRRPSSRSVSAGTWTWTGTGTCRQGLSCSTGRSAGPGQSARRRILRRVPFCRRRRPRDPIIVMNLSRRTRRRNRRTSTAVICLSRSLRLSYSHHNPAHNILVAHAHTQADRTQSPPRLTVW